MGYVRVFTQGNNLPWNAQTILSRQHAKISDIVAHLFKKWKLYRLAAGGYPSLRLKTRVFHRSLINLVLISLVWHQVTNVER